MDSSQSTLILLTADSALQAEVACHLKPFGWRCEALGTAELPARVEAPPYPAAVLVDCRAHACADAVQAVRQARAPFNGIPVIAAADRAGRPPSARSTLSLPLDGAQLLDALSRWAGPLDAHGMRADPHDPRYRLIRLLGLAQADEMLGRFRIALADMLASVDAGSTVDPADAHRLAGIAGLVGYSRLGGLWSRVEHGEQGALTEAVAATRRIFQEI